MPAKAKAKAKVSPDSARPRLRATVAKAPGVRAAKQTAAATTPLPKQLEATLASIKGLSTERDRANLARFGIVTPKYFGVSMANIQKLAKRSGKHHELALLLWKSGWYEARMLAALLADPARVTPALMDSWCRDFDNWAICDTLCFHLFDRTPHAWDKVAAWRDKSDEFEKRAAFALLASLAGHDKVSGDKPFLDSLRFIERAASDERNFVKKGVNWALRRIGWRNAALNAAAVKLARRLAESPAATPRWVGKDALRELTSAKVLKRFGARRS